MTKQDTKYKLKMGWHCLQLAMVTSNSVAIAIKLWPEDALIGTGNYIVTTLFFPIVAVGIWFALVKVFAMIIEDINNLFEDIRSSKEEYKTKRDKLDNYNGNLRQAADKDQENDAAE